MTLPSQGAKAAPPVRKLPLRMPVPHTSIHQQSRRFLEPMQDILVLILVLVLFALMLRTLWTLLQELRGAYLDFRTVIAEVLFVLVMIELVRLLIVYLQEHRVAVDFMVELGIVSTLREIVLRGVVELHWEQILALSLLLLTLGALLRFADLRWPRPDDECVNTAGGGFTSSEGQDVNR